MSFLVDIDADVMAEIRLVTLLPDKEALACAVGFGRRVLDEQRRGNKVVIVKGDGSMIELTPLSEYGLPWVRCLPCEDVGRPDAIAAAAREEVRWWRFCAVCGWSTVAFLLLMMTVRLVVG